ncbi:MAG: hypothetical protein ACI4IJ_01825 [Acutalibacteraceae bacterium]
MMSSGLASWQAANRFHKEGDVVYGVYQGCGFTVSEEDDGKLFIFMLLANDDSAFDNFENALATAGGAASEGQVGDVENYLAVFFDESAGEVSDAVMDEILSFTASRAKQLGFRVPNRCVRCGERATKRSFVDNMVQPLCADCSAKNKQNRKAAAQQSAGSSEDDNYAQQYAPITASSSLYDENYDEYAGMTPSHADYISNTADTSNYNNNDYADANGYNDYNSYNDYNDNYGDAYAGNNSQSYNDQFAFGNDDDYTDNAYNDVMGRDEDNQPAPDVEFGGSMGMGILGVLVGSVIGVMLYIILALFAHFPMGALCCPAGMLAVILYTVFGGRKSKSTGMALSIGVSVIISLGTIFLTTVLSYTGSGTDFGGAVDYLFGDGEQTALLAINMVLAALGSIFGACFFINVMDKYVATGDTAQLESAQNTDNFDFN